MTEKGSHELSCSELVSRWNKQQDRALIDFYQTAMCVATIYLDAGMILDDVYGRMEFCLSHYRMRTKRWTDLGQGFANWRSAIFLKWLYRSLQFSIGYTNCYLLSVLWAGYILNIVIYGTLQRQEFGPEDGGLKLNFAATG